MGGQGAFSYINIILNVYLCGDTYFTRSHMQIPPGIKSMASPLTPLVDTALENLIENYHDLNAPFLDESFAEPSALEFMRAVAKNRPFVIRKGAASWPAVQQWNVDYLKTVLKNTHVNVANTPFG